MQSQEVESKHSQQKNGNVHEAPDAKWTRTLQWKKEDPPRFLPGLLQEQQKRNPAVGARQAVVAEVPPQFSEVVASQVDDDLDRRR